MGLFNSQNNQNQLHRSRTRISESEQQALKAKARNRLVGAIVLIILAIIVVPAVLDTNDTPEIQQLPSVAPLVAGGHNDSNVAGTLSVTTAPGVESNGSTSTSQLVNTDGTVSGDIQVTGSVASDTALIPEQTQDMPVESVASGTATASANNTQNLAGQASTTPDRQPESKEVVKKQVPERTKPVEIKKPDNRITIKEAERTDDGSRALALLEGRSPSVKPKSSTKVTSGNYSLQIASYSSSKDAQDRREKLITSGVSNAYVQSAMVNGKQQYRLRVGPFNSREAAQAAQTRLRTLGYDNGFISSN
ncbi:SPOR domain-containing protein [Advenella mandrilli]|nr:SPOR domain-containing protein [Advenella mandrilli]